MLIVSIVTGLFSISSSALAAAPTAFAIAAGDTAVSENETVTFTISGQNIPEMFAYEVQLTYDSGKLEYKSSAPALTGNLAVKASGDQVKIGFSKQGSAAPSQGSFDLLTITFKAKSTAGSAGVTLQSVKVLNNQLAATDYSVDKSAAVTISSSQSTPTPIPTPTPTPTPKTAILNVNAVLDDHQIAQVVVNEDDLAAAFNEAKNNKVTIKVAGTDSAKEVHVSLPAAVLKNAGHANVEVDTGLAILEISPDKLSEISSTAGKVELSVIKVDTSTLSNEAKSLIGDNSVYDFNLSVDGVKIETFKKQAVTVKLKYALKPGENPDHVVIYYIDDKGKLSVVENGKYDPATGQVVFKPKHFSKYTTADRNVSFNDIANLTWAVDSIRALLSRDILTGSGDGSFNPGDQVTRAEFIVMLMRSLELVEPGAASTFKDVIAGQWYTDAIGSAQKLGIVKGYSNGTFGVKENISRQEMAAMLYKAAQLAEISLPNNGAAVSFSDQATIAPYAVDAVEALTLAGVVNGVGEDRFAPAKQTTRAEAAVIIWRVFEMQ